MHKVEKDARIWVYHRDGNVTVFKDKDELAKIIQLDIRNKPYLTVGLWYKKRKVTIGNNWNDKGDIVFTHSEWDRRHFEIDTSFPVDCLVMDALGRVINDWIIGSWANERKDSKKEKRNWKDGLHFFEFRKDPVPGIHKFGNGHRYFKHPHCEPEKRASQSAKEDGVKWRAKRSIKALPDPWDDIKIGHSCDKTWKNKKIKRQWMKGSCKSKETQIVNATNAA